MDCADQRSSESTCGGGLPSPAASATWAAAFLLQEATGDSECDDLAAAAFDADDGDAESCSGGDDDCSVELDERRLVSWECWMMESAGVVVEAACPASKEADSVAVAGDPDSDRLFWEACIAHGY